MFSGLPRLEDVLHLIELSFLGAAQHDLCTKCNQVRHDRARLKMCVRRAKVQNQVRNFCVRIRNNERDTPPRALIVQFYLLS